MQVVSCGCCSRGSHPAGPPSCCLGQPGENLAKPLVLGCECFTIIYRCPFRYRPVQRLENQMPSIDVATPVSSAPTDRLALGVGWVRPGVAGIGGTLNPSLQFAGQRGLDMFGCFEGNEE
jgi:hypothetical protein